MTTSRKIGNGLLSHDRAPSHRKLPWPRAEEIAERLEDGETHADIAASIGRSVASLRTRLGMNGFDPATARPLIPLYHAQPPQSTTPPGTYSGQPWADQALCAQTDPEVFFPEKGSGAAPAKAVCRRCPVRQECLAWALETDQRFGVWGALTDHQRAKLRRATRKGAAS